MADENQDPLVRELVAIKRLVAFALLRQGASQDDLGRALGIDQSSVSRMFPSSTGRRQKGKSQRSLNGVVP